MAGHESGGRSRHAGRTRGRRRRRTRRLAAAVGVLALVAGGGALAVVASSGPVEEACPDGLTTLRVAAAPEIAPVVTDLAGGTDPTSCVRVEVTAVPPAAAAAGVDGAARPDVWIPDSSVWVPEGAGGSAGAARRAPVSLASSPVVLAVTARAADAAAGEGAAPSGALPLLTTGAVAGEAAQRLVLADPTGSAPAAAVLAELEAAASADRSLRAATTAALRSAVPTGVTDPALLLATLTDDHAVPVPEQGVWAHNAAAGATVPAVSAVYPGGHGSSLDYPFVVLADDVAAREAAERLLDLLRSTVGRSTLQVYGFRDPAGRFAAGPQEPPSGVDATTPVAVQALTPATVQSAADVLTALNLGSRLLAVIDISGSMGYRVDDGPRRLDLVKDAAASGLGQFPADSQVGLWVFSSDLTATSDHRELVPIGPLDEKVGGVSRGSLLLGRLEKTTHKRDGGTALYDTTLAAVREVRSGWDPRRVNTVVIISDGKDDGSSEISLGRLLKTLRAEADPARPVPVITIGYGPEADAKALGAISEATGGATYASPDPRSIREVFFDAVGQRVCRPAC